MCGRFSISTPGEVVAEAFALPEVPDLEARYNVAPTQDVAIVRSTDGESRELAFVHWGLIPSWAKDPSIGNRLINARAETAAEKPAFRAAFRRRRCLIVADGFFEWAKTPAGKQPHLIRFADGRPFGMAGLWENWSDPRGESVDSCTILTTTPNKVVAPLHDRMPVIVPRASHDLWLAPATRTADELGGLLVPHDPEGMIAFPVTRYVNNPGNDDPRCIEPAGER